MPIAHHPDDATLMSFAAGALPEALSVVVTTHLMACAECRSKVREMEDIGAFLLGGMEPVASQPVDTDALLTRAAVGLDGTFATSEAEPVTDPIQRLTGQPVDRIEWKRLGWGVWHYPISLNSTSGGDLRLLRVQKGQALPEHGHGGSELTLVLEGSYHDEIGTFAAGDIADLDDTVEHRPIADGEYGCICLVASERRARFTGVIGKLLQPIARL
ncbi:MAG: ChrR family anti-sigma-E factor [Pseudomonadota bacterium]